MNSIMDMSRQAIDATGTARRVTGIGIFSTEATAVVTDSRWVLVLMIVLVVADFRFGMTESKMRYKEAEADGDKVRMDYYKWHPSRAWRRTFNKLADYIVIMLICQVVGMALLMPVGISYIYGIWAGGMVSCVCEIFSIFGHFFFIHGVTVEKRNVIGFAKALAVAIAKKKDEEVGEALGEALNNNQEGKNNGNNSKQSMEA